MLLLGLLASPSTSWASKSAGRALLQSGADLDGAVKEYSSAASSADAEFVAEYALSLAYAGLLDASLEQMDRAFVLDLTDDEVLFAGAYLFDGLGIGDAAAEVTRPAPEWATHLPPLPKGLASLRPIGNPGPELLRANDLMEKGRYASAIYFLNRLVAKYPNDPLMWEGYSIALEKVGAFRTASQAVARDIAASGTTLDADERTELQDHQKELAERAPLTRPKFNEALKGRYTAYVGGSLSAASGTTTVYSFSAQAGKFFTNYLNLAVDFSYSSVTKGELGLGGRYHFPLPGMPVNLTAGTRVEYDSGVDPHVGWLLSPGLSWFIKTSSLDLIVDFGILGAQKGTQTINLGYTFYFGGGAT